MEVELKKHRRRIFLESNRTPTFFFEAAWNKFCLEDLLKRERSRKKMKKWMVGGHNSIFLTSVLLLLTEFIQKPGSLVWLKRERGKKEEDGESWIFCLFSKNSFFLSAKPGAVDDDDHRRRRRRRQQRQATGHRHGEGAPGRAPVVIRNSRWLGCLAPLSVDARHIRKMKGILLNNTKKWENGRNKKEKTF